VRIVGAWLELSVWAQLLALVGFYGVAAVVFHLLTFHSRGGNWAKSFRGVVAPFFVSPILIFGLLLGFVATGVWQRNAEAVRVVRSEGDILFTLQHLSPESEPGGADIQQLIRGYAQAVAVEEWPLMRQGKRAASAEMGLTKLLEAIVGAPISGGGGAAVQKARLDLVLKLHTLRETRIELAGDRTDEVKWATLLLLGIISQIGLVVVHLETPRPQIAALAIFTTAAVIGLGLVALQERPFARPLEVTPAPLEDVVREIPARGS
jgi:hypothetical protein